MIVVFKSKAAADIIMFGADAHQLMKVMGKDTEPKGIITVAQLADAIQALETAVARDEAVRASAVPPGQDEDPPAMEAVSLRQRAKPLLDMLRRCLAGEADVVWGV